MSNHSPATQRGQDVTNEKGRFRVAVPAWNWGTPLFRFGRSEESVSREEMTKIFSKELEAPALMPRRMRGSEG